jgi:hypothetical protein
MVAKCKRLFRLALPTAVLWVGGLSVAGLSGCTSTPHDTSTARSTITEDDSPAKSARAADDHSTDQIIPFHSVNGFIPGLARYSTVESAYGAPDEIEVPKRRVVAGIAVGGNRIVHYTKRGMHFLLSEDADPVIEGIYVELPYAGRAPNGLFLGMAEGEARAIIRRDYHVARDLGDSLMLASDPESEDRFQVWFEGGRLVTMRLDK